MAKARVLARSSLEAVMRSVLGLLPRRWSTRSILLACSRGLMAEYLAEVWEILRTDPRLTFRLLMPYEQERPGEFERIRRLLPVREIPPFWARARRWDLVILADHSHADLVDAAGCPVVRISHGFPGKRVGGQVYLFGDKARSRDGRIRYSRIFVPSEAVKDLAVSTDPAFEKIVTVVGSPGDDRMLAELSRRDEYRRRFGFRPDDTVVFVMSTWGPHSLFPTVGDALLAKARQLQSEFRFILSTHPLEYRPKPAGQRVWGEYLRGQSKAGFIVREPSEDWVPYMVACDIVLTDHTSLAVHCALLGRPLVYVPLPDDAIEEGSILWQLREISPVIKEDASDLRETLLAACNSRLFDELRRLAAQLNSCPGQSTDRIRDQTYKLLDLSGRFSSASQPLELATS